MERFVGPGAGTSRAGAGVPVSAEERLAALLRDELGDYANVHVGSLDVTGIAARLIAAGVSVPAEPGASNDESPFYIATPGVFQPPAEPGAPDPRGLDADRLRHAFMRVRRELLPTDPGFWEWVAREYDPRTPYVSRPVPAEPGAPDLATRLTSAVAKYADDLCAAGGSTREAVIRTIVRAVLASLPVPAPEPSHSDGCAGNCGTTYDNPPCPAADPDGRWTGAKWNAPEPSARLREAATEAARVLDQVAREHRERLRQGDLIGAKWVELAAEGLRAALAATPQDPEA